jgi:assimilatory nitrate reductase catalytic subunit
MARLPVDDLVITRAFGPHLSPRTRGGTEQAPDKLVKTHCCFCGQQCGIQLKVRGNEVIGFEPWEDFPFNRGMLCPKGVKRYLQGSHPDRLLTALRRDPSAPGGFSPVGYEPAIAEVAREIRRIQTKYGNAAIAVLGGASLTTEKTYLLGKFARVCLKTPYIDYNGRLCMVSAGAANKKAFGIDRTTNPWSDMVGTEVIWVAGSNAAECSPITTNYIWQARELGAKVIVQDPRITPLARTCDLYLPVRPGRDAALFAGVLGLMIEHGWIDREFIAHHTVGFEAVEAYCKEWPPARTARRPSCGARRGRASCSTRAASSTTPTASRTRSARSTWCSRPVASASRRAATARSSARPTVRADASTGRSAISSPAGARSPTPSTASTSRAYGRSTSRICRVRASMPTSCSARSTRARSRG